MQPLDFERKKMAEPNAEIRIRVHIQAVVNGGINFADLRKAFEDACDCIEQQQYDFETEQQAHEATRGAWQKAVAKIEQQQECIRELLPLAKSSVIRGDGIPTPRKDAIIVKVEEMIK